MKHYPTRQELIDKGFVYDPESGNLFKVRKVGAEIETGYMRVTISGKNFYAHRLAFILMGHDEINSGGVVDHINGNRSDNRWENLRLTTQRRNSGNKSSHRGGRLIGCRKVGKKYRSMIGIGKEVLHLGMYKTEAGANLAYRSKLMEIEDDEKRKNSTL